MNQKAKVFMNGRSQAVRLPREFRFESDEVFVRKQGDEIILSPKKSTWDSFFDQPTAFGKKFLKDREQAPHQERDF